MNVRPAWRGVNRMVATRWRIDVGLPASTVVADDWLSIDAGRDVRIEAGVNRESHEQASRSKSTGVNLLPLPSKDNLGLTLLHDSKHTGNGSSTQRTAAPSRVGCLGGDVSITAGQRYQQTGSDVLALAGDVDIAAQRIDITEAREARSASSDTNSRSTVIGATPRNALVDAIQGAKTTLDTAKATTETGNARVKAIGTAATVLNAASTAAQVNELMAKPENIASVTIDFNLGTSKSRSESTETAETGRASTVAAAGDVRIAARGAGADSDLLIRGSDVSAGSNALLKAEGDVSLQSSQERATLHSRSQSSGASVGVGLCLPLLCPGRKATRLPRTATWVLPVTGSKARCAHAASAPCGSTPRSSSNSTVVPSPCVDSMRI